MRGRNKEIQRIYKWNQARGSRKNATPSKSWRLEAAARGDGGILVAEVGNRRGNGFDSRGNDYVFYLEEIEKKRQKFSKKIN